MPDRRENALQLPATAFGFMQSRWEDVAPFYEELERRLLDPTSIEQWLADWSRLEALLTEAASRAMIRYTVNTADKEAEADHLRLSTDVLPRAEEHSVALQRRLVESGYSSPAMAEPIRRFQTQISLFRAENVPLWSELETLGTEYQRITGGMTAEWNGQRLPLPQLQPFLKDPDRAIRERAFRRVTEPYIDEHDQLAGLFDRMHGLRSRVARNAGFANFRDYTFPAKFRFDYTPDDCLRFHDAVEAAVLPAYARLMAHRRERLALAELRPWDTAVDLYRKTPLRAFRDGKELAERGPAVFTAVDPELGREFGLLRDEGMLDLDSRAGKAPGGYCDTLQVTGRPFIFMNAVGLAEDVMTLLHEAGHAFHAFASQPLPLLWQRHPGAEMCELASMSMELLAVPHLSRTAGFFSPDDLLQVRVEHLEDIIVTLAHVASIDAFQHWLYTNREGADARERDAAWLRIRSRFETGIAWDGLEPQRIARWFRQLHVFLYPFYYIEYGIAQLGALQVWRNSRRDPREAVRRYREALALGATKPLPELYAAAGVRLAFDAATIGELVAEVEEELDTLRAALPAAA